MEKQRITVIVENNNKRHAYSELLRRFLENINLRVVHLSIVPFIETRNPLGLRVGDRVRALKQIDDPSFRYTHAKLGDVGMVVHLDAGLDDVPTVRWEQENNRVTYVSVDVGDVEQFEIE